MSESSVHYCIPLEPSAALCCSAGSVPGRAGSPRWSSAAGRPDHRSGRRGHDLGRPPEGLPGAEAAPDGPQARRVQRADRGAEGTVAQFDSCPTHQHLPAPAWLVLY